MLRTLIEQAQRLPGEVETLIRQAAETKQRLHDLLQDRAKLEAQVAGEVANETNGDGKKKYPNEEARKAEIARRLQASEIYQVNEEAIRKAREAVVDLEARLDRNRYEHRAATALLNLLAAAIQAGRQDVEEAVLTKPGVNPEEQKAEARKKFTKTVKEVANGNSTGVNGNGLKEAKVTVLEARPGKTEGTIRAYCQTEGGEKVAVYGKNGTGKKLATAIGEAVVLKFKEIDHGWFAMAVN
jgi:protein tyrosine phosphatase (PTP) superfamily phosphohydrolase (DUF442 family)